MDDRCSFTLATVILHEQLIHASHVVHYLLDNINWLKYSQPPLRCITRYIVPSPHPFHGRTNLSTLLESTPYLRTDRIWTLWATHFIVQIIAGVKNEWSKEESSSWFQDPHDSLASEFYWTSRPKERQKTKSTSRPAARDLIFCGFPEKERKHESPVPQVPPTPLTTVSRTGATQSPPPASRSSAADPWSGGLKHPGSNILGCFWGRGVNQHCLSSA